MNLARAPSVAVNCATHSGTRTDIVASVARLAEACEVARTVALDFAVLDVNLDGEMVFPAAHIIRERQIPFIFSTGYGATSPNKQSDDVPVISKPFAIGQLNRALQRLLPRTGV